jgi:hypothetical protein
MQAQGSYHHLMSLSPIMRIASTCWPVMPTREAYFALGDWSVSMMKWPAPGLKVRLWLGGDKIFGLNIAGPID